MSGLRDRPTIVAEALLRRVLPPGTVGESILGDLRQEYAEKWKANGRRPWLWHWRQTLELAAHYAAKRLVDGKRRMGHGKKRASVVSSLLQEARLAFRRSLARPGRTAMATLVLGLGIGASAAMFSVVHAVLIRPLPYERPEELVLFLESSPERGETPMTEGNFVDWRDHTGDIFETLTAFRNEPKTLSEAGGTLRLEAMAVSANVLELTGVRPLLGHGFDARDDRPGAEPTVLLSYGTWRSRFGGDPNIVGTALRLDGVPHLVVGVTPSRFVFPPPLVTRGVIREYRPELFVPLLASRENRTPRGTFAVARLRDGLVVPTARARLQPVVAELARQQPDFFGDELTASLTPLREQGVSTVRTPLLILLGAVGIILLIACLNVATLLLAEAQTRGREVALRTALGASRRQIVRQLLVESVVLALFGGVAGVLVAFASHEVLLDVAHGYVPLLETVHIDTTVLLFTLGTAIATGVFFCLAPVLDARKPNLASALKTGSSKISGGPTARRALRAVVVGEIALAVMLLVSAGLLVKSLQQMYRVDLGFDAENLFSFRVRLPEGTYRESDQVEFVRRSMEALRALPSVESASAVTLAPLAPGRFAANFDIEGRRATTVDEARARFVDLRQVSPEYFEMLGLHLLTGRAFSWGDDTDATAVCIIDALAAREHWQDRRVLGSEIILGNPESPNALRARVVGVVAHAPYENLTSPRGTLYFPIAQLPSTRLDLLVRSRLDAELAAAEVRDAIASLDPELAVELSMFEEYLYGAQSSGRSPSVLLSTFAAIALAIALAGFYAVMSYSASTRRKEIGLRMTLGARPREILKLFAAESGIIVAVGLALGLSLAYGASRILRSILFEVEPGDPWTFSLVAVAFLGMAFMASVVPTLRAARVDPAAEIRDE